MTIQEALQTPHEACPRPECAHPMMFAGRRICSLGREAMMMILVELAKVHPSVRTERKLSDHIIAG